MNVSVVFLTFTIFTTSWALTWPIKSHGFIKPTSPTFTIKPSDLLPSQLRSYSVEDKPPSIHGRIVNGLPASTYQFPWFASVRSHTPHGLQSICGGSIISKEWVLTAAHCTRGFESYTLGFGSNLLNEPLVTMHTTEVIEHSKYNPMNLNYDIAIIKLPNPLCYTAKIQAIRMPSLSEAVAGRFSFAKARVCGYGRTDDGKSAVATTLNWVEKRVISNTQCSQTYGPSVIVPSTICAIGWQRSNQSTCNGDSGGPLVIDDGGVYTQIGIVSFVSNQGCASGHPAGYVRLTSFLNWISTNAGIPIRT